MNPKEEEPQRKILKKTWMHEESEMTKIGTADDWYTLTLWPSSSFCSNHQFRCRFDSSTADTPDVL